MRSNNSRPTHHRAPRTEQWGRRLPLGCPKGLTAWGPSWTRCANGSAWSLRLQKITGFRWNAIEPYWTSAKTTGVLGFRAFSVIHAVFFAPLPAWEVPHEMLLVVAPSAIAWPPRAAHCPESSGWKASRGWDLHLQGGVLVNLVLCSQVIHFGVWNNGGGSSVSISRVSSVMIDVFLKWILSLFFRVVYNMIIWYSNHIVVYKVCPLVVLMTLPRQRSVTMRVMQWPSTTAL